ncbi:MAG TPA: cytochrome c3 family protein [Verrucomicrobiae bacterium]|nr:cytochrome c3 family protein [Verrucomicrobiae bacterium]
MLIFGCAPKQPEAPPSTTPPPAVQAVNYLGSDTCKGCHGEAYDALHKTEHFNAFKPISDYPLDKPLGPITVFDSSNKEKPTSATIDLSKEKVYGVMVDDYIIAQVPASAGFKDKIYRIAAVKKVGDKWTVQAAKQDDVDKDGKPDWSAESFPCGKCHAPGIDLNSKDLGISCESCHGPGGNHVKAEKKKGTMITDHRQMCLACHAADPVKDDKGNFTTNNHQGTRDWFASKHAATKQANGCLACHNPHKANASGKTIVADKPADICVTCHAGKNLDPEKIMWKNPSDPYGHITRDHSFGAIKYEELGDDPKTKPIEITNTKIIELIKQKLPALAK